MVIILAVHVSLTACGRIQMTHDCVLSGPVTVLLVAA